MTPLSAGPVPLGPVLSLTGFNIQRYNPQAERALYQTPQGYNLEGQKQTARRIAKAAAGR
jgi:hypothetical protein